MMTCDMCGGFRDPVKNYQLQLHGPDSEATLHMLDLCASCKKRLSEKLSETMRSCRISAVKDAIRGLTSDQVNQVEVYIAQLETKKQELK